MLAASADENVSNLARAIADRPLASLARDLVPIYTHIDVMGGRPPRFRGAAAILGRLWRLLRARRKKGRWNEPIGLLTQHTNLDERAWAFLDAFLGRCARPASELQLRSVRELATRVEGAQPERGAVVSDHG